MNPVSPDLSNEELILTFLADGGDEYISGEALSDKLGLSRTAVWKHVESLRLRLTASLRRCFACVRRRRFLPPFGQASRRRMPGSAFWTS